MLLNTFSFGEGFPIRGSDYRNKIILLSNLKIYIWLARGWTRGWTFKKSNSFQVAEVLPASLRSPTAKHLRQRLYDVTQWARLSAKNVKYLIYFSSANKSHLPSKKRKIGIEMFCVNLSFTEKTQSCPFILVVFDLTTKLRRISHQGNVE